MGIFTCAGCSGVRTRGLEPAQDQSHGGCHKPHYRGVSSGVTSKNGSLTLCFLSPDLHHLVLQIDIDQVAKFKLCYWTSTTQSSAPAYCSLKINQKLSRRSLTFRKAREQAVNVWQLPKSFELCTFHWLILTLVFIACCDNSHKSTFLVYIESSIKSGHQGSLDSKWIYN